MQHSYDKELTVFHNIFYFFHRQYFETAVALTASTMAESRRTRRRWLDPRAQPSQVSSTGPVYVFLLKKVDISLTYFGLVSTRGHVRADVGGRLDDGGIAANAPAMAQYEGTYLSSKFYWARICVFVQKD